MKILVCGHGRHGKDQFCEYLGVPFSSSSMAALDEVIWPAIGYKYPSKEECFEDRINCRRDWFDLITEYNVSDPLRLAKKIFARGDVYCGLRNVEEFRHAKNTGLVDISVWIDSSERVEPEDVSSCTVTAADCDITINNNGTLKQLKAKADRLAEALGLRKEKPVKDVIVQWADSVFPDRTITNAIHKLVLEEIPEYLLDQTSEDELGDIGILVYDIAHLAGVDLDTAIRKKMEINLARTWAVNPVTGLMKHRKDGAA